MRGPVLLAVALFAFGIMDAKAAQLKDCSRLSMNKRISCLQENLIIMNKSNEETTAKLQREVADLSRKINNMTTDIEASRRKKAN